MSYSVTMYGNEGMLTILSLREVCLTSSLAVFLEGGGGIDSCLLVCGLTLQGSPASSLDVPLVGVGDGSLLLIG